MITITQTQYHIFIIIFIWYLIGFIFAWLISKFITIQQKIEMSFYTHIIVSSIIGWFGLINIILFFHIIENLKPPKEKIR